MMELFTFWSLGFVAGIFLYHFFDNNLLRMMNRPLPPPAGMDELDLAIYKERPDMWKDCASQRMKNKFFRRSRREKAIKYIEKQYGDFIPYMKTLAWGNIEGLTISGDYIRNVVNDYQANTGTGKAAGSEPKEI